MTRVTPGQFLGMTLRDFVRFLGEAETSHGYQIKTDAQTHKDTHIHTLQSGPSVQIQWGRSQRHLFLSVGVLILMGGALILSEILQL